MCPPLGFARADAACSLEAARFFTSTGLNGQTVVGLYGPCCAQFFGSLILFIQHPHLQPPFSRTAIFRSLQGRVGKVWALAGPLMTWSKGPSTLLLSESFIEHGSVLCFFQLFLNMTRHVKTANTACLNNQHVLL